MLNIKKILNNIDATNKNDINSLKEGDQKQPATKDLGDRKIIYNVFRK